MAVDNISQINIDFISSDSNLKAFTNTTSLQISQKVSELLGPNQFLFYGREDFMPEGMTTKQHKFRFQNKANAIQDITDDLNATNRLGQGTSTTSDPYIKEWTFPSNPQFEDTVELSLRRVGEVFTYGNSRIAGYDIMADAMDKTMLNVTNNEHAEAHLAFNRLKNPDKSVGDATAARDHLTGLVKSSTGWSDADTNGGVTDVANSENKCNYGGLSRLIVKSRAGFLGTGEKSLCVLIDSQDLTEAQLGSKRMASRDFQDIKFGTKMIGQDVVYPDAFPDVKFITTGDSGAFYKYRLNAPNGAADDGDGGDLADGDVTVARKKNIANYGKAAKESASGKNIMRAVAFTSAGLRWFYDALDAKAITDMRLTDLIAKEGRIYMSLFMNLTAHAVGRYTYGYEYVTANDNVTLVSTA